MAKRSAVRASYPMRVVQRLTGLSPDTIRAWERRYGAIEPARSEGRTRHFSDEDVRRLILLRQAVDRGHRISAIAGLSGAALSKLVDQETALSSLGRDEEEGETEPEQLRYATLRQQYVDAILRFDATGASELLSRASALLDRDAFVHEVVVPTLREIGDRWEAGELSPAHEHLVSAQTRGLLETLLRQHASLPGAPKVIITTPAGEHHEHGVVVGALLAATRGFTPVYLGPNLPVADILLAVETAKADLLVLGLQHDVKGRELTRLDDALTQLRDRVDTWVGLPEGHRAIHRVEGVRYFVRFEDFDAALLERGARHARSS